MRHTPADALHFGVENAPGERIEHKLHRIPALTFSRLFSRKLALIQRRSVSMKVRAAWPTATNSPFGELEVGDRRHRKGPRPSCVGGRAWPARPQRVPRGIADCRFLAARVPAWRARPPKLPRAHAASATSISLMARVLPRFGVDTLFNQLEDAVCLFAHVVPLGFSLDQALLGRGDRGCTGANGLANIRQSRLCLLQRNRRRARASMRNNTSPAFTR